ncbi:MAG: hypothetical protein R6T92_12855 [Desulfosalsimonadaceae bacterium]
MATINDLVLVYLEEKPLFFARIEDINPDHKKDWYHVTLLVLQVPVQTVTWTLRDAYISGDEFTMGGKRMRLEKVSAPKDEKIPESGPDQTGEPGKATVISFAPRKPDKE